MAFTIAASATNIAEAVVLKVFVITGGSESGGANVVNGGFGTPTFSFTPNGNNSLLVEGIYEAVNGGLTITPAANNTTDEQGTTPTLVQPWWYGHYTGTVTSGVAVSLGGTDDNQWTAWGSYEVTSSGSTPAINATTPAGAVSTTSPATTASFTPPAGAVLVAVVLSNGSAAQVFGVSDTSGLGLTWTQRGSTYSSAFVGSSAVFTTTMPGSGPALGPAYTAFMSSM